MSRLLSDFVAGLSRSERALLSALVFCVVPLALVMLVALPMIEARDAARARQADAIALADWVTRADAEWQRLQTAGGPSTTSRTIPVAGIAQVEQALEDAGLRSFISTLEYGNQDVIRVSFRSLDYGLFTPFLDRIEPELGRTARSLRLETLGPPGLVSVAMELAPLSR